MIVDLERNDLGRVCEYGSVHVTELAALEAHPTVFHLVGDGGGPASKERPRQPIACGLLSPAARSPARRRSARWRSSRSWSRPGAGVYTGAIGYLGWNGQADLNIAIRTMVVSRGRLTFHVGGGIVADSEPEAEYQETLDKAQGMLRALQGWNE